jgi:hypothetical protein
MVDSVSMKENWESSPNLSFLDSMNYLCEKGAKGAFFTFNDSGTCSTNYIMNLDSIEYYYDSQDSSFRLVFKNLEQIVLGDDIISGKLESISKEEMILKTNGGNKIRLRRNKILGTFSGVNDNGWQMVLSY